MPRKKDRPMPVPCLCGRSPVVAKAKGRNWIVACPAIDNCTNCRASGWWPTESEAVTHWDEAILELLRKEGAKK